jgi:acyl-CoA thioesterase I
MNMRRAGALFIVLATLALAACSGGEATGTVANSGSTCDPIPPGNGPFTYVAIGASDAVGVGATCPATQGYVPLLGTHMPHNAKVVNLGIAGATVKLALGDEVSYAIQAKPNVVTVWLAANDFRAMEGGTLTLAQYSQQLDTLLGDLSAIANVHVYVANLPDLTKLPYFIHGKVPLTTIAEQTAAWNVAIAGLIAQHGDIAVDLFHSDIASHPEYIWVDGFHPSTLGYVQLANAFWTTMQAHGEPHA